MKQKPRGCPVNLSLIRRTSFTATACATRPCSLSSLPEHGSHVTWFLLVRDADSSSCTGQVRLADRVFQS